MRKLIFIGASVALSVTLVSHQAAAVGERPYWPAYEYREVPEGCIKWNWQELSYYNYCARIVHPYRSRVLRVRG
jgi:hypothetical protein